ncbi:DUF4192 family protein [Haloglycomyces albus]|uniref:DUF4192 family protein n=1 Tax=Haloglycomyces albus TaxID=526067 RepID=UPI00046CDBC2|nr:DUF4192 family protein [Haloglycomyces albus]
MSRPSLSTPADIAATIPYLIGYRPDDQITLVALRGTTIAYTATTRTHDEARDPAIADTTIMHLTANTITDVAIIGYSDDDAIDVSIAVLQERLHDAGIFTPVVGYVSKGCWHSIPTDQWSGQPLPDSTVAMCHSIDKGASVADSRQSLIDTLQPVGAFDRAPIAAETALLRHARTTTQGLDTDRHHEAAVLLERLWDGQLPRPDTIAQFAAYAIAVSDESFRRHALQRLASRQRALRDADTWIWVARHLTDTAAGHAYAIVAVATWLSGRSLLAHEAIHQSRTADADNHLARLMSTVAHSTVDPNDFLHHLTHSTSLRDAQ